MKVTYDEVADAAKIYLVSQVGFGEAATSRVCETDLKGGAVVLDFDTEGKLLGIELLGVSNTLRPESVELLANTAT